MEKHSIEKLVNPRGEIMAESKNVHSYKLHMHMYYEMTLYEPFDGDITVNGKVIKINDLTAIMVSPSDFHAIHVNGETDAKFIKIGFNADVLDMAVDEPLVLEHIKTDSMIRKLFCEIYENRHDKPYELMLINCAVFIMRNNGAKILSQSTVGIHDVCAKAMKLTNEQFRGQISLSTIANQIPVTPQYLSKVFKKSFGLNFTEYLIRLRLQYAFDMIKNTRESITNICFESGFDNFSYFSRSFKRQYGASPKQFRNNLKL